VGDGEGDGVTIFGLRYCRLPGKNKATKLKTAIVEKKTGALLAVVIGVRTSGPGKSLGCDKKPSLLPSVFRPNSVTLGKFR
jgi:hypothetical protein